jgi:hypothetical protein
MNLWPVQEPVHFFVGPHEKDLFAILFKDIPQQKPGCFEYRETGMVKCRHWLNPWSGKVLSLLRIITIVFRVADAKMRMLNL